MQIREILAEHNRGGTRLSMTVRGTARQTLKSKADNQSNNFLKLLQSFDSGGATTFLKKFLQKELKILQRRSQVPGMSWKSRKRAEHLLELLRKKSVRQNQNFRKLHQSLAAVSTVSGANIYSFYGAYLFPLFTAAANAGNIYVLVKDYKRDGHLVDAALIAWFYLNIPLDLLGGSFVTFPVDLLDWAREFYRLVNADDYDDDEEQFTELMNDFDNKVGSIQINPVIDSAYKKLDQIDRAAENLHYNPDLENAKREVVRMYPDSPKNHIDPHSEDLLDIVDNNLNDVLNVTKTAREAMQA